MTSAQQNWIDTLRRQAEFYQGAPARRRTGPEFPWAVIDAGIHKPLLLARTLAKQALKRFGWDLDGLSRWLEENAERLWVSRSMLADELSRTLFDSTLVLRLAGHQRFFFPRTDFEDLVDLVCEEPFRDPALPADYLGLPLKVLDVRLRGAGTALRIVANKEFVILLNGYRQYLIRRDSTDYAPAAGEVVLDCGACIGEMSMLFAGLVGPSGQVHLFDPVPLHGRYCRLQASLNPSLSHVMHVNELAVGRQTHGATSHQRDSGVAKITPGFAAGTDVSMTTIDDYVSTGQLSRVDFIKMDIEGSELDALEGAANTIRNLKPRLAISAYHRPDDFWTIPLRLKALNPAYKFYFGQHSPVPWESVFYAV